MWAFDGGGGVDFHLDEELSEGITDAETIPGDTLDSVGERVVGVNDVI